MNELFRVSVIIPTWNRIKTLSHAIESALHQTYPPLEVLVCDDGSTDCSRELVEGISDPRVKWVSGDRGGRPAIPRNRGISKSQGNWLAFLDSDDRWCLNKLEMQINGLKESSCKASCSNAFRLIKNGDNIGEIFSFDRDLVTFDDELLGNTIICSSVLVLKDIVVKVGGFPEDYGLTASEDYALWLKVCTETDFAYCVYPLLYYTDVPSESVRQFSPEVSSEGNPVHINFIEWSSKNPKLSCYASKAKDHFKRKYKKSFVRKCLNKMVCLKNIIYKRDKFQISRGD